MTRAQSWLEHLHPSGGSNQWFGSIVSGNLPNIDRRLQAGQRVNQRGLYGRTGLFVAADAGRVESLRKLIEAGAKLDIADHIDGDTPLHVAAYKCHVEAVRLLIFAGANVQASNYNGRTPFDLAMSRNARSCALQKSQVTWLLEQAGGGRIPRGVPLVEGSLTQFVDPPIIPVLLGASANPGSPTEVATPLRSDRINRPVKHTLNHPRPNLTSCQSAVTDVEGHLCLVALCPPGINDTQGEALRLCVGESKYAVTLYPQMEAGDFFHVELPLSSNASVSTLDHSTSTALYQPAPLWDIHSLAARLELNCSIDRRSARRCAALLTARGFPRHYKPAVADTLSAVCCAEKVEHVREELCCIHAESHCA